MFVSNLFYRSIPLSFILSFMVGNVNSKELSLEALLTLPVAELSEISFTSERRYVDKDEVSAVVTIVTEDDIERAGYRTVYDVIRDTPSQYFNTSGHFENLTTRGISQTLSSFLLLIDGHAVNNRSAFGISTETVFPRLSNIARIEIVHGAGSVLWGGEAGLGIIHIITKSGSAIDIGGTGVWEIFTDYENNHQRYIASANYGKRFDQGDLMLSVNLFNSGEPRGRGQSGFGSTTEPQYIDRYNANWDFEFSGDLYLKAKVDDFLIKGYVSRFSTHSFDNSQLTEHQYNNQWLELTYSPTANNARTSSQSRVFYNDYLTFYNQTASEILKNYRMVGVGGESMFFYQGSDFHLTTGVMAEQYELSFLVDQNGIEGIENAPLQVDQQSSLFAEFNYNRLDDWLFTLGGRAQRNDGILNDTFFLPRFAAVRKISPQWQVFYAYNASTVQPNLELWRGGEEGHSYFDGVKVVNLSGANKAQEYYVQDIQFQYRDSDSSLTLGLFYIDVENMIYFFNKSVTLPDDTIIFKRWLNGPGVISRGMELTYKRQWQHITSTASYTYSGAEYKGNILEYGAVNSDLKQSITDSGLRVMGAPKHSWNVNGAYDFGSNALLNVHYRGYYDLPTRKTIEAEAVFQNQGVQHFLDLTLILKEIVKEDLDITLYVKNVLDNDAAQPDTVYGGFTDSVLRRQVGGSINYKF